MIVTLKKLVNNTLYGECAYKFLFADPMAQSHVWEMNGSSNDEMNQRPIKQESLNSASTLFSKVTITHIVCFFIGLIVCGIPLVMSVMSSFKTPGSTVPPVIVLPTQCYAYTTTTDSTRLHTYERCCETDYNLASGWYRFIGNGGTRLITRQLSKTNICGASYPGWWNGTLPMIVGTTNVGNICFYDGNSCANSVSPISATNCSGYYVFYLTRTPCCTSYRYCTTF